MSLNSRCPCKYFTGTEFEKITDLKNIGLIIYRRGVKKLNDFTPIANIHNSTIALYNSKNINIIPTDLTQEFEKNKVSCPRCIHIVEYTQKLLQNVPVIGKKDTRAICDHCRRRSQLRTGQKCDETEKEFALFRKEQVINKREIELLLIRLLKSFENVLQNASTENESDDLYFHGREKDQEKKNGVDISKRHSTSYADISEIYNSKTAFRISLRNNKSVQKSYSQINLEKRNKPHRSKESLIITRTKKTLTSSQAKDGENYQSSFLSSTGEVRRILQKETNSQLNETYSKNIKDVTKKINLSFDKQRPTDVIDLKSNKIVKASNLKPEAKITSTIKKEVEGDLGETLKEEMDTNRRDLQIERTDTKSKHNYESDLQRDDSTRRGKKVSGVTNYEVGKSNTEKGQKYSSKGVFQNIINHNSNPQIATAEHKPDNTKTKVKNAKEKPMIESRTSLVMDKLQSNIVRTKQNHITEKPKDMKNKNNLQISTAEHKPDNTKTKVINTKEKSRIESRTSLGMDEIQSNIRTKQNHIIGKSGDIKNKNNPKIGSTAEHKPDNTKTKAKEKSRIESRTNLGMNELQSNIRTKQNHITGKFGDIKNKNNPKIGSTAEHKPDNTKTKAKEKSRIESRTSLGMNELQKNKRTTQNLITEKTGDIKNINNPQITTAEHRPDKNTKTKVINAKEKLRIETSTSLRMDELQSNRRTKQNHITEKSEDIKNKNNPQISTAEHKPDNTKTKAINTKEKPRIQTSTSLGTYELQSNICTKQKHITELEIYKAGDIKNNNTTEKWISTKGESGLLKNDSIKNDHRKDLRYDNRLEQKQDEKDMNVNEKEVKEDSLNTIKKTYVTNNEFIRSRISKNTDRKELSESQKNLTPSTGNQKNTERTIGDKEKFKFQPKNSGSRKEETHDKFNGIPTDGTGIIKYALSDRQFIDKGWTLLPLEKICNKEIIYSMRPAHPELDWFEHNKAKGSMQYSTGEKLAEFDDNGHGRWYYKNGRLALDYSKDLNGISKIDIYSSGQLDQGHHSNPITVLATFDYNGNGVVFDHDGNVRLKYNQKTGVVLDRKIGPISRWKWHSLISLERRKCMMVETHLCDPNIMKLGDKNDYDYKKIEDEEMLKVELANDINKILKHEFILYQIQTKLFKINDHFSLRIMDQATIHIIFRDGLKQLKLNIGMILNNKDIIDIKTVELEQV